MSQAMPNAAKIPLHMRMKAWWHGYELQIKVKDAAGSKSKARPAAKPISEAERKEARIALLQKVFGEGLIAPGGKETIIDLAKPCGLSSATNVLNLGAGLGGEARAVSKHFGAWVEGRERDPDLKEAAMELSDKAGLAKKAPVNLYDPEFVELPSKTFNGVLARDEFFKIEAKERLLHVIKESLKDNGHLHFTDLVLAKPELRSKELNSWAEKEPLGALPVPMDDYLDFLRELRFDIRIAEDITEKTQKAIVQCWSDFLDELDPTDLNEAMRQALVTEVELWTLRGNLLESGQLKACRIHAVKKVSDKLLSDWAEE